MASCLAFGVSSESSVKPGALACQMTASPVIPTIDERVSNGMLGCRLRTDAALYRYP